jgi:hypothetical protein
MKIKTQPNQFRSAPVPGAATWQTTALPNMNIAPQSQTAAPEDGRAPEFSGRFRRAGGYLIIDAMVGLAILTLALLPLGYTFVRERQLLKIEYCRSVADEIVDGEMEILVAGAAKNLPDGSQNYSVQAAAATQLPPGHFQLTKTGNHLRLEWTPDVRRGFEPVVREATLK